MKIPSSYQNRFESNVTKVTPNRIDSIARRVAMELNDPEGLGFYIKMAKTHTEAEMLRASELAKKYGRNKGAYFNRVISNGM